MRRHNRADAARNRRAERHEFNVLQPLLAHIDYRQVDVRIGCRAAVPRKMFCRGKRARGLRAFDKRAHKCSNCLWVLAVRANINNRIVRIVVDVSDGRVEPVDAGSARLACGVAALQPRVLRFARRGHSHVRRPPRRIIEPHPRSHLQISGDQQRNFRHLLQAIGEHGRRPDLAAGEDQAADFIVHDLAAELLVLFALAVQKDGLGAHRYHLPDLLIELEPSERLPHPLLFLLRQLAVEGRKSFLLRERQWIEDQRRDKQKTNHR